MFEIITISKIDNAAPDLFVCVIVIFITVTHTLKSKHFIASLSNGGCLILTRQVVIFIFIDHCSNIFTEVNIPSDRFGLADKVRKFAVSGVWQQHANSSIRDADYAKNNVGQHLVVNTCKQNKQHWNYNCH